MAEDESVADKPCAPGVSGAPGALTGSGADPEFPTRATSPAWKRALFGTTEKACGDGHKPKSREQASEKFPGEGAWRWGSGPTRKE